MDVAVIDVAGLQQLVSVLQKLGSRVVGPTLSGNAIVLDELGSADPATHVDLPPDTGELLRRLASEHDELREAVAPLREAADQLVGGDATATMSRTHAEIQRLADRIGTHVALARAYGGVAPDQTEDLLACLYGLHALLQLHFLQEEENYFTLTGDQ